MLRKQKRRKSSIASYRCFTLSLCFFFRISFFLQLNLKANLNRTNEQKQYSVRAPHTLMESIEEIDIERNKNGFLKFERNKLNETINDQA